MFDIFQKIICIKSVAAQQKWTFVSDSWYAMLFMFYFHCLVSMQWWLATDRQQTTIFQFGQCLGSAFFFQIPYNVHAKFL